MMETRGMVSVIIPCYNQAQYLPRAIDSVLKQTYTNFEIIVVNDGSPDNTREVAEKYVANNKCVKLINQSNKGLSAARNAGIMSASGEFFLPLDADDWIDKEYLSKTVIKMESDPTVGVVYTALETFGETSSQWCHPIQSIKLENLKDNNQLYVCSLVRMKALKECGGYNTKMIHGYEDWDLWIDICKRGWSFRLVPEPLFKYMVKKQSMVTDSIKNWHYWNIDQIKENHPDVYK